MPVSLSDIHLYKSAIGDSAGGAATGVQISAAKNSYWPDLSDLERASAGSRIRKSFLGNDHASDSLIAPLIWISPDVTGFIPTQIGLGFDSADDDTGLQGNMSAFSAPAQLELSSTAADTRAATVVGIDNATGEPISESVVLNGSTPVLSAATFSSVLGIWLDSENGSNVVTAKEGSGGTERGVIGPNLAVCFLWVTASSEATALHLPDLISGGRWGIWEKQAWSAGVLPVRPADPVLNVKEGV